MLKSLNHLLKADYERFLAEYELYKTDVNEKLDEIIAAIHVVVSIDDVENAIDAAMGLDVAVPKKYKIKFVGDSIPTTTYNDLGEGFDTPNAPMIPERDGYIFEGWMPELNSIVDGNLANDEDEIVYTAIWKELPIAIDLCDVILYDHTNKNSFKHQALMG